MSPRDKPPSRRNVLRGLAALPWLHAQDPPLRRLVPPRPTDLRLTPRKASDQATAEPDDDGHGLRIRVNSPSGIGALKIERAPGAEWPSQLAVRLKVRGLERFQLHDPASGRTLTIAISTTDGTLNVRRTRTEPGEDERPVEPDSPDWIELHSFDTAGRPTDRLPDGLGAVEIILPTHLLSRDVRSLTVDWVDFFRN